MKKVILLLSVLSLFPSLSNAFQVRNDRDGEAVQNLDDIGVQVQMIR